MIAALVCGCYVGAEPLEGTGTTGTTGTTGASGTAEPTTSTSTSGEPEASTSTVGVSGTTTGAMSSTGVEATTGVEGTTDGTSTSTTSTTTGVPDPDPDVPAGVPYCVEAASWDSGWAQLEEDILVLVNQERAKGADCGSEGVFGPAGPLTMEPHLRCAGRMHSKDMNDRDFFSHTNPDGDGPGVRIDKAQYGNYSTWGENIAAGSPDAAGTMMQWMGSDGHCSNIMNPDFQHIGVGYHPGGQYGHLWTQVFGAK